MEFTRTLRKGMSGDDVLYAKQRLFELGMFDDDMKEVVKRSFGSDTYDAVIKFQTETFSNKKERDGVIGRKTWAALFSEVGTSEPVISIPGYEVLDRFSDEIKNAIIPDLETVSEIRRAVCLDALQFAIDPYNPPEYPRSFYIRGGNLYDKRTGKLNIMSEADLNAYFSTVKYRKYYDGGREEMMREAAAAAGFTLPGCDCSGEITGLWINNGVKALGFDSGADDFFSTYCVQTDDPAPADLPWKSGHIGLCVGGGRAVEHVGGAYGCQLTKIDDRRCYNFLDGKLHRMGAWEAFGDPKRY